MHDLATDSNTRSISGAHLVNDLLQNTYRGFLINSINVISKPHCIRNTYILQLLTKIRNKNVQGEDGALSDAPKGLG